MTLCAGIFNGKGYNSGLKCLRISKKLMEPLPAEFVPFAADDKTLSCLTESCHVKTTLCWCECLVVRFSARLCADKA